MPTQILPRRQDSRREAPLRKLSAGAVRRLDRLLDTRSDVALAIPRLVLGVVMFIHASQKVFGWFGGPGFSGSVQGFRESLGIPLAFAILAILAEIGGSLSLIVGFAGRVGAACIIAVMTGAILIVHAPHGFFMNWYGKASGEGFEYHLLAIGLALPILLRGSGALSVDLALLHRLRRDRTDAA
jgi:putative oxidoreductase